MFLSPSSQNFDALGWLKSGKCDRPGQTQPIRGSFVKLLFIKTSYSTPLFPAFECSAIPESIMLDQCSPFGFDLHKILSKCPINHRFQIFINNFFYFFTNQIFHEKEAD